MGLKIVEASEIYDIQIRARSSLFGRFGCILSNGLGTVEVDFPDTICALVYNLDAYRLVTIPAGESIVQMVLYDQKGLVCYPEFPREDVDRDGGFGSTDWDRPGREL